jgi:hypothetical protein
MAKNGRYKKIVLYDPKTKKWMNRFTGQVVSEKTAHRYNTRYLNLRKQGLSANEITMNMLYGNKLVYKKGVALHDQKEKVEHVMRKQKQIFKTKNVKGQDVYLHPQYGVLPSQVVKEKVPVRIRICGGIPVYLYRMNGTGDRVYHVIAWNIGKVFRTQNGFIQWRLANQPRFDCIFAHIPKILKKYPLFGEPYHYGRVSNVRYNANTGYMSPETGSAFGQTKADNLRYIENDFNKTLNDIEDFIGMSGYTTYKLMRIYFFFYDTILVRTSPLYQFTKVRRGIEHLLPRP